MFDFSQTLLLVISKFLVTVIKYMGKVLCLWTCMDHKYQENHIDYFCCYQVTFLSLSIVLDLLSMVADTLYCRVIRRYNRNVTVSRVLLWYNLVKSVTRVDWKNWHCCDMFEDFETFQSAMKKKIQLCVVS